MTPQVLTPWYPADTKPVRDGVYIVIVTWVWTGDVGVMELARWDGKYWRGDDNSFWAGVTHWRGLAFDPETGYIVPVFKPRMITFEVPR